MRNISKQEIIPNLKDKISQSKSSFSNNKELRKEVSELNFDINWDTLKNFYKNKPDEGKEGGNILQKEQKKLMIFMIFKKY